MKKLIPLLYSQLGLCLLLQALPVSAEEPAMDPLNAVLEELSGYRYGDPETWKPDLIASMQSLYRNPGLYADALERLQQFKNASVSDAAKQAVQPYIRILREATADTRRTEDYDMETILELVAKPERSRQEYETILKAAEHLASKGKTMEAVSLYRQVYNLAEEAPLRTAAMRGEFFLSEDKAAFVKTAIREASPELKSDAIRLVSSLPPAFKQGSTFLKMSGLTEADRIQLVLLLSQRRDPSIHQEVRSYAKSSSPELRAAALQALVHLGSAEDLSLLLKSATRSPEEEAELAQDALNRIQDKALDQAIVEKLKTTNAAEQKVLLDAVEKRNISAASPALLALFKGQDRKVASRAIRALALVADTSGLRQVMDQWMRESDADRLNDLERTMGRIAIRLQNQPETLEILEEARNKAANPARKATLSELAGKLR